jgi:hypothetical protein
MWARTDNPIGQVAGKWRYEQGRFRLEPFDHLPRKARHKLEDEADRMAAFHADECPDEAMCANKPGFVQLSGYILHFGLAAALACLA